MSLKWLSEAKLKTRSGASLQNIANIYFRREASLRAFCFASLTQFRVKRLSEAKLKTRSEASRQNVTYFDL